MKQKLKLLYVRPFSGMNVDPKVIVVGFGRGCYPGVAGWEEVVGWNVHRSGRIEARWHSRHELKSYEHLIDQAIAYEALTGGVEGFPEVEFDL